LGKRNWGEMGQPDYMSEMFFRTAEKICKKNRKGGVGGSATGQKFPQVWRVKAN